MKGRQLIGTGLASAARLAATSASAQTGPTYNRKMATGWAGGPLMAQRLRRQSLLLPTFG
jgi:hypothetical protein